MNRLPPEVPPGNLECGWEGPGPERNPSVYHVAEEPRGRPGPFLRPPITAY
jgi:hypothetical protein